jgi:hypothetical protein
MWTVKKLSMNFKTEKDFQNLISKMRGLLKKNRCSISPKVELLYRQQRAG